MKKLLWIISFFGLAACQTSDDTIEPMATLAQAEATRALFGTWKFQHYTDGKKQNQAITLEISAEKNELGLYQLSGKAPVNFYFAQVQLDEPNQGIRLQGVGSTKMAGPPEAMQQETRYFQRLADVRHYAVSVDQNTLVLTVSSPQTEKLTFTRTSN